MNLAQPNQNTPVSVNRFLRFIGRTYLRITGWRIIGEFPSVPRCVIPVAPHTSNWDFVHGIACVMATGMQVNFLGKHTLFKGVLGKFMYAMGGIPVERHAPKDLIDQVAQQVEDQDKVMLVVAPEGTRSKAEKWKTGFLRIAYKAELDVVPAYIDFPTKTIGFLDPIKVTGDVDQDMVSVQQALKPYRGKYPDKQ